MFRNLALAVCGCVALSTAVEPSRVPVLVELFTSEGCSSCPPADRLLERLDPQVIVLSEHVDYWDHQGWRDPFSSHVFTQRQEDYARGFGIDGPYTPQMVVDGAVEFVGSDAGRAAREIDKEERRPRTELRAVRSPAGLMIDLAAGSRTGDVMLALADPSAASQVAAGENKGRSLRHVAVVRSLRKVGSVRRGASLHLEVPLPAESAGQRAVLFIQETGQKRIWAAAMAEPYKPAP